MSQKVSQLELSTPSIWYIYIYIYTIYCGIGSQNRSNSLTRYVPVTYALVSFVTLPNTL